MKSFTRLAGTAVTFILSKNLFLDLSTVTEKLKRTFKTEERLVLLPEHSRFKRIYSAFAALNAFVCILTTKY